MFVDELVAGAEIVTSGPDVSKFVVPGIMIKHQHTPK
jgi:hypothetical protein